MAGPNGHLTPAAPGEASDLAASVARVAASIARYELLQPGCRVLAAVSGGRDSTALTILLDALGYEVVVGHVDHAIRPESERDTLHCEALATRLGLAFRTARLANPPSGEAAARQARYQALEEMAPASGASRIAWIATGHTLDDAAETVAIRLGRGGAAIGIPPRRGRIVRPLIELRRRDTETVCRAAGVAWIDDPTNDDERHHRNRLRRRAIPALGEAAISRLAAVGTANAAQAQRRRADAEAIAAALVVRLDGPSGERCEIDRTSLANLPSATALDIVRLCLEQFGIAASQRVVRDVVAKVATVTGAGLDLPGGMRAWSDALRVVIGPAPGPLVLPDVTLATPGGTVSSQWGLTVKVEEVDSSTRPASGLEAIVDPSTGDCGLVMRQRRPGDRFVPVGAPGRVRLQDLFVDHKVPREDRERVPIIVAGSEIVWVPGFRIGERWKVAPDTPSALRIRLLGTVQALGVALAR